MGNFSCFLVVCWFFSKSIYLYLLTQSICRGGSRISGKVVHIYNGVGVCFADFISFFVNIPWKWNHLVSLRPNYFIFIGYLKTGGQVWAKPLWIHHWFGTLCQGSTFFEKFLQVYHQSVKHFISRSGPSFCWAWSGSNLFVKVFSRWQQ